MQAVLTSSEGGDEVRIERRSGTFWDSLSGTRELRLGSQDLLRLAFYASEKGFKVASFLLADTNLDSLPNDEGSRVSDELINILMTYGVEEAELALEGEFEGLFIIGINLISVLSGKEISVRRWGYIHTSAINEARDLLNIAWQELHLS